MILSPKYKLNARLSLILFDVCCGLLLLLFLYTAISKLLTHKDFVNTLGSSVLLARYAQMISWFIPIVEICIALLLFFPSTRLPGLYASALLLFVFTVYIVYMLNVDKDISCTCGGVVSALSWKQHIVFNAIFLLITIFGILIYRNQKHHRQYSPP